MVKILPYFASDWPKIEAWWKASGETAPLAAMMPLESSFVAYVNGQPALAVALYLTNTPQIAYVENFIGNPECKGAERREAAKMLSDHIAAFARSRGFASLMCMTEKQPLKQRYMELGFQPTLGGLTAFVRRT